MEAFEPAIDNFQIVVSFCSFPIVDRNGVKILTGSKSASVKVGPLSSSILALPASVINRREKR